MKKEKTGGYAIDISTIPNVEGQKAVDTAKDIVKHLEETGDMLYKGVTITKIDDL